MFDLMQTIDKPTHRCGHAGLDWILHRRNDDILQTTHVSYQLTSDHFTIICDLDLFVPSPPTFTCKRKLSSIDNCILMQDIKQYLESAVMFTAAQLDSVLRSLLDKHAPMYNCKVSDKKCAPWYDNISDTL